MSLKKDQSKFKLTLTIIFIPLFISLLILLTFLVEKGLNLNFVKAGIYPREPQWLWTVFSHIFIHANWSHLANNLLSFSSLSSFLYYFYRPVNNKIFLFLWISTGLLLWIIGRESRHIGASGLIYALASFLFFSGLIRRHIPLIAIALMVTLFYGNMVWHIFPWQVNDPVSWEGHLAGLISGFLVAIAFRKSGPQKPNKIWEDEDEDDESELNYDVEDIETNSDNSEKEKQQE